MQTLERLSLERGRPRIRLYVPDAKVRPTMQKLKMPNVVVHAGARRGACHCTLVGGTGQLVWEAPER